MYILLSLGIAAAVVVVAFQLLTNFKASVLMVGGTLIAFFINYGMSKEAIYDTAPQHLKGLVKKWIWYKAELNFIKIAIITALIFIGTIQFFWYLPHGFSMNFMGTAGSVIVLMISSFMAHLFGTLRGIQIVLVKD